MVNIGPLYQTQTLMSGRTMPQRKERGQCLLRGLGLVQPPKPSETAVCQPATVSKAPVNVKAQTDALESSPPPLENAPVHESTP